MHIFICTLSKNRIKGTDKDIPSTGVLAMQFKKQLPHSDPRSLWTDARKRIFRAFLCIYPWQPFLLLFLFPTPAAYFYRERVREREARLSFTKSTYIFNSPLRFHPFPHVLSIITAAALSRLIFNPRWFSNIRGTKISKFPARTYPTFALFRSFSFSRPVKITRVPVKNTHRGWNKNEGTWKRGKRVRDIFFHPLRGNDEDCGNAIKSFVGYCSAWWFVFQREGI